MFDTASQTIFSLSGGAPPPSRDWAPGLQDLRAGALVRGRARELCLIRKFAGGGAVLHIDSPVTPGDWLELELPTGQHLGGTVAWTLDRDVGIAFDTPVDVFAIIACDLVGQPGERRALPRVELDCPAAVETERAADFAGLRDISQAGAKIMVATDLEEGEDIVLTPEGFRPIAATVRWRRGRMAGLLFREAIGWQELMPWLKARRNDALRAGTPPEAPAPPRPGCTASPAPAITLTLPARIREGTKRWNIDILELSTRHVVFESFSPARIGALFWLVLPGLQGWPARIADIDGYRFTCEFTQELHPAVLDRILAEGGRPPVGLN